MIHPNNPKVPAPADDEGDEARALEHAKKWLDDPEERVHRAIEEGMENGQYYSPADVARLRARTGASDDSQNLPRNSNPEPDVVKRGQHSGSKKVHVLAALVTGKPGHELLEVTSDCICVIDGGSEEKHREFHDIAESHWLESDVNKVGSRTLADVLMAALWGCARSNDKFALRDVVAAAGPRTLHWVAFLAPGSPAGVYGSVSKEHFELLAAQAWNVQRNGHGLENLFRTLRQVAKPQGSNFDHHVLVNKVFHPADPLGYEPAPDLYDEEGTR